MIFDIKMEDFRRSTNPPSTIIYTSVVSRDTVRIALTFAALNDLQLRTADIQNACIQAPLSGKISTLLGPEFGRILGSLLWFS